MKKVKKYKDGEDFFQNHKSLKIGEKFKIYKKEKRRTEIIDGVEVTIIHEGFNVTGKRMS